MAKAKGNAPKKSATSTEAPGILLQEDPAVYMAAIPGRWLLEHSTPSWRISDPERGFQRIVKEARAKEIAHSVLDMGRTFPNSITLATKDKTFKLRDGRLQLPARTKFLVVDGQHRLWAQNYSEVEGTYPCILHMSRTEEEMAELFLEINDNQKRVPSSLRWDLIRLVRNDDPVMVATSEMVYALTLRADSPFYGGGLDLTGEKKEFTIKQGSLAPEIKTLLSKYQKRYKEIDFDVVLDLLIRYFTAIRSIDPAGWETATGKFFKARVLRALLRVLADLVSKTPAAELTTMMLLDLLSKISEATLSPEALRATQGSAGVQDLYAEMAKQMLG